MAETQGQGQGQGPGQPQSITHQSTECTPLEQEVLEEYAILLSNLNKV